MSASRLTPLELAAGFPLGPPPKPEARREVEVEPADAFRLALSSALARPPCLVSFSGGRDSSTVLALATETARREGLPLPVPATARFPGSAESEETVWQEEVVRELALGDWHRFTVGDELDCVGGVAQRVLLAHGVLWPPNSHFHEPLLAAAAGGSLLTGIGGDEVLGPSQWTRQRSVLERRARPVPRDAPRVAVALSPRAVRRLALRRAEAPALPWLRPGARARVLEAARAEAASEPLRWHDRFRWLASLRYVRLGTEAIDTLALGHDVQAVHPFLDPGFLDAVAALPRARRFDDRERALELLFGDAVPARRRGGRKARFDTVLWGSRSRELAAAWDGEAVDPELVDVDALRARWRSGEAGPHTLLQSIWLASAAGDGEDRVDRPAERGPLPRPAN